MFFQSTLPGCCSVGLAHTFGLNLPNIHDFAGSTGKLPHNRWPSSGHFLAIFHINQKAHFDKLCKYNTCISAVPIPGGHGQPLAVCIFKWGK